MKVMDTKGIIINEALTLFSKKGYDGASVRDIAAAVGIKAASLYKHFSSKEDIFDGILDEMSKRYNDAIQRMQVPSGEVQSVADEYMQITQETLVKIATNLFLYFLKDDFAAKFRRLLTIEQFRSSKAGSMFQDFFLDSPINFQSELFKKMMEQGTFKKCDPYIMAMHFYAPIFVLLNKYDHLPEKEEEAIQYISKHVIQFSKIYSM